MSSVRFLGVLVLGLCLLMTVDSLALAPGGWGPAFHRLWGAVVVVMGLSFAAFGRRSQGRHVEYWVEDGEAEVPLSLVSEFFGVVFAVSGTAYGLTGEVWLFSTCILMGGLVFEFGSESLSD